MVLDIKLSNELKLKFYKLIEWLKNKKRILIMLSGGLDSGVLAYISKSIIPEGTFAVTMQSGNIFDNEVDDAIRIANELEIKHIVIKYDVFEDSRLRFNPNNRCYICKKIIIRNAKKTAKELKIDHIMDGTNIDDLNKHRPGKKALDEENILSPLVLFGFSKSDLRTIADKADLFFKDKPAESCIFTRFPYNSTVTLEDLNRVRNAEDIIRNELKVTYLRVRDFRDFCRIEVDYNDFFKFTNQKVIKKTIKKLKKLGYKIISLDLEGYRSGSMDS
jgi:uncharacterized protein